MEYLDYEKKLIVLRTHLLQYPEDINVKYKLAKTLLKKSETVQEARELLQDLLDTKIRKFAMLELGKLEAKSGNTKAAKYYLMNLLSTKNRFDALFELGNIEKKNGNFEESIKYYSSIINEKENSDNPSKDIYNSMALLQLIFIEIHRTNYEKAYLIFNKLLQCDEIVNSSSKDLFQIGFYLKYKLAKLSDEDMSKNGYFIKQLLSYDEGETINHIKLHFDENNQKIKHTLFLPELDLKLLYEQTKNAILSAEPYDYSLCDKYVVDLNFMVGKINNQDTRMIKVITFSNTKHIITMYPIENISYQIEEGKKLVKKKTID